MLVDDRKEAEAIVTVASGALSTDEKALLIGIPALQVPFFPIGTSVSVPEIALFKSAQDKGVAKFVATGYDAKTGKLIATTDPQYGISHQTNHTILLFFSWQTGDLVPARRGQELAFGRQHRRAASPPRWGSREILINPSFRERSCRPA